jgi:glycosyltransferase involved in cell wall biosynthesis
MTAQRRHAGGALVSRTDAKESDMKIAVVSTIYGSPWGGSEELWAAMLDEALDGGHEVAVSLYRWPSVPSRVAALQERGMRLCRRPLPRSHSLTQRLARRVLGVRPDDFQEIMRLHPDVVLVSEGATYHGTDFPDLLHSLYQPGKPYVVVCHWGSDACIPNAKTRELAREFYGRAFRVAFVSQENWRTTERQLGIALPNALVVRNPVNLADRSTVAWPSSGPIRMASVARLDIRTKGQDVLFESLASAPWRTREWRLRLCGDGPDRQYLGELAAFYGIADRIDFLGHVPDIRALWADNHLLVMPSRAEGTPLAMVEAMLCGRPCVLADVGGVTEWVEEPRSGFIAAAPTVRAFRSALERAWITRKEWPRMGLQAHQVASDAFDPTPGRSLLQILLDAAGAARERCPAPPAVSLVR